MGSRFELGNNKKRMATDGRYSGNVNIENGLTEAQPPFYAITLTGSEAMREVENARRRLKTLNLLFVSVSETDSDASQRLLARLRIGIEISMEICSLFYAEFGVSWWQSFGGEHSRQRMRTSGVAIRNGTGIWTPTRFHSAVFGLVRHSER